MFTRCRQPYLLLDRKLATIMFFTVKCSILIGNWRGLTFSANLSKRDFTFFGSTWHHMLSKSIEYWIHIK